MSEQLVPAPALLEGVSAVEYGQSAAIGFAGRLLTDLGVTVTKIEPPEGDRTRFEGFTAPGADCSALFAYANAGKRSVVIDDTTPEGRDDLARLLASAEIVLDGHEASHWDEIGLDFDALPGSGRCRLAVSLTPFGRFGDRAGWEATHLTAHHTGGEAYAFPGGLSWLRYPDREPVRVPSRVAELDAGTAAGLTMLGWLAGDREPAVVELSWQEAAMALSRQDIVKWPNDGFIDTRATRQIPVLGLVECLDGWVEIYPSEQHMWERLVLAVDSPEWAHTLGSTAEDRIKHTGELNDLFAVWLKERSKHEIYQALRKHGVPGGPVRTMEDIFHCEQMRFRDFFGTVSYPDGRAAGRARPTPTSCARRTARPGAARAATAPGGRDRPGPRRRGSARTPRRRSPPSTAIARPRSAPAPRSRSWRSRRRGRSAGSRASASSTSPGTRRGPTET